VNLNVILSDESAILLPLTVLTYNNKWSDYPAIISIDPLSYKVLDVDISALISASLSYSPYPRRITLNYLV
jgi:hypothetical protein